MATQWGQTSSKHTDINIQREFERKSSPVIPTEKTKSGSSSTSNTSSGNLNSSSQYTVYHNGIPVNTIGQNQSLNFTDVIPANDTMKQVSFTLRALGDNGKEDVVLAAFVPSEPWYIERFTLDIIDTNAAQNLDSTGKKYRIPKYHDVVHNIDNPIYSIYNLGADYCIPDVQIIEKTFRVTGRISDNYETYRPFLNTKLGFSSDINENIGKFDNVEFLIIVKGIL